MPDKVPVDFGGTAVTGIHVSIIEKLRDYYGLEKRPVKTTEAYQMLGWVEDDLKDAMGIDVESVFPFKGLFGFSNENWKEFRTPWGQVVLVPGQFNSKIGADGDYYIYPEGDVSALPSGHMPRNGYFFDSIVRQQEIDEDHLNPADNLEEFKPFNSAEIEYYKQQAAEKRGKSRAVIMHLPCTALGDIALVPAPFLKNPKGIRDIAGWYMIVAENPEYVHGIFEKQVDIALQNLEVLWEIAGDIIDVGVICGTDFGTQDSQFCSPAKFRELWLPYYKKINNWIHSRTHWKTFKHSCGAIDPLIPLFIEAGFDILNPVQCSARGMDPEYLKKTYGRDITFWGGGVNTQKTLPFGTSAEVREEVLRRLEIFSRDGGFVFNSIHNVQALTPIENMVAMMNTVKEFNGKH